MQFCDPCILARSSGVNAILRLILSFPTLSINIIFDKLHRSTKSGFSSWILDTQNDFFILPSDFSISHFWR